LDVDQQNVNYFTETLFVIWCLLSNRRAIGFFFIRRRVAGDNRLKLQTKKDF